MGSASPAQRSAAARLKTSHQHDEYGHPYRSFAGLPEHTLTRNQVHFHRHQNRSANAQNDVRMLIAGLNQHLLPLSPLEFQFKMTAEEMAEPGTTVFVGRDADGHALGCGAAMVHQQDLGDVKRMFTLPEARYPDSGWSAFYELQLAG